MAERRLIRPDEYGAVLHTEAEPTIIERQVIEPPDSVRLDTGEYVSKGKFSELTPTEQAYLKKHGVKGFNEEQERVLAEKLTPAELAYLKKFGIEKFNIEQERVRGTQVKAYEEAVVHVERETAAQEKWVEENIIEVGPENDPILRSSFEKMEPTAQVLIEEVGITEFNRQIVVAEAEYNSIMAALTSEQREEVLLTGSYTIVESEADAIRRVRAEAPWATNIVYDKATGQITYNLPEPVAYLRDKPGDIAGLIAMGHDEPTVRSIDKALAETKDFWNEDGSFQGDKYLRLNPDKEDNLRALGFTPEQVETINAYNSQPLSKSAFTQMYFADREWKWTSPAIRAIREIPLAYIDPKELRQERHRYNMAALAYIDIYGKKGYFRSAGVQLISVPLPALRALYPEVTIGDITGTEWAFTVLIPISIISGGLVTIAGTGLAGIALRSTVTLAGAGITTLMGYETVRNWENMTPIERTVAIGFTTLAAVGTVAAGISTVRNIKSYVAIRPTLSAAKLAGQKNVVMVEATKVVKSTKVTSQRYSKVVNKLQHATRESIAADLKFLDKFAQLKKVDLRQLARIEKLTGMGGLKNSIVSLIKEQRAYEATLNSLRFKKTPITSAQATKLANARNRYFKAIDKFSDIAQPRSISWRVPTPERTIIETQHVPVSIASQLQSEWNAVADKLRQTKVGGAEYYRLINKQQSMIRRSYTLAATEKGVPTSLQKMFEEIDRYVKEHPRVAPESPVSGAATAARTGVATALRPAKVVWPEVAKSRPAVTEPKVAVTTEVAEKAVVPIAPLVVGVPGIVPGVVVTPPKVVPKVELDDMKVTPAEEVSAFPGLTATRVKVSTPTKEAIEVSVEHIGAMTPEQAQRLYGSEIKVDAIGKPIAAIDIGLTMWMSPADAVKVAQKISAEAITKDMVNMIEQLYSQNATQLQINVAVQEMVKQATKLTTKTALRTALQTQLKVTTRIPVRTGLRTGITTIKTPITPFIPIIPSPGVAKVKKARKEYPAGTVVWRQGVFWKIIPPPYKVPKPISSRTPPAGVTVLEGTPQETLTFLKGKVPFSNVSFDLGVTDGYIDVKAKRIRFKSDYEMQTDVGRRLPSTTKGLSLEREKAEALGIRPPRITRTKVTTVRGASKARVVRIRLGGIDIGL